MRVAILFEYPTLNGGEHSLISLQEAIEQHDCQLIAFAPPNSPLAEKLQSQSFPLVDFSLLNEKGSKDSLESIRDRLVKKVMHHQVELLHGNSLSMGRLLGKLNSNLPCPTTSHLRDIIKLNRSAAEDLNRNAKLIAVSDATRQYHINQGLHEDNIVTIHNGIDAETFLPKQKTDVLDQAKQKLSVPQGAILILSIGQIGLRKGWEIILKAAFTIASEFDQVHFLMVGERYSQKQESIEYEQHLYRLVEQSELKSRFHWLGYQTDIPILMQLSHLLVHGAHQEPFGRVLLEAGISSLPIVATDVGGTSEMLNHGESGLLVPPNDARELADAIRFLLSNPLAANLMGKAAHKRIAKLFPVSKSAARLYQVWSSVLHSTS